MFLSVLISIDLICAKVLPIINIKAINIKNKRGKSSKVLLPANINSTKTGNQTQAVIIVYSVKYCLKTGETPITAVTINSAIYLKT
jgi:hypothetical protein